MVSPTLITPGVKRRLHNESPEHRGCEVTKTIDLWIYVDTYWPWDIRGIGRLSVRSEMAHWRHPGWRGPTVDMPCVTLIHAFHIPYVPIRTWHMSPIDGTTFHLCLAMCHPLDTCFLFLTMGGVFGTQSFGLAKLHRKLHCFPHKLQAGNYI